MVKIDKANLINILDINIANDNKTIVLPSNETEEKLVKIFANVLDMPKEEISIKDNFFEIGGDSLSAIKICTLIQKELEKNCLLSNYLIYIVFEILLISY